MIQKLTKITSALGVAALIATSIIDFLKVLETHKSRIESQRKLLYSDERQRSGAVLINPTNSTNVNRNNSTFPKKLGQCRICENKGYTEWHHIISQHHARKTRQFPLLRNPGNIVELCKKCHNQTSASKSRYLHEKKKRTNKFW